MTVAIGNDHAGYAYKKTLVNVLKKMSVEVIDKGSHSPDSSDYPDFAHPVARAVQNKEVDFGILICGSGNGVAITANKHQSVRAAICWKVELAEMARLHNNANILAIPARYISKQMASKIVKRFLSTPFEGGRHLRRVNKISSC